MGFKQNGGHLTFLKALKKMPEPTNHFTKQLIEKNTSDQKLSVKLF